MTRILELFGVSTAASFQSEHWKGLVDAQQCPFLGRKCIKVRKSQPSISIGTCTVAHGTQRLPAIICPFRLLENRQVFLDCIHLLTLHEPGNELHVLSEISIPGGNVDYFLASVREAKVRDFVGIEIQTLDSTGTVWPERERFLASQGLAVERTAITSDSSFGINWKMSAKTILVQMHHKIETFQNLSKHLVLVIQDHLLAYMQREFSFGHISNPAQLGEFMHIHGYNMKLDGSRWHAQLGMRVSTNAAGVATALGLKANANIEYEALVKILESKLTAATRISV